MNDILQAIQDNLTDDLLQKKYKKSGFHSTTGHCYVASEAAFHLLGGKAAGYKAMFIRHEGMPHWWLLGPRGEIIDLTAEQFLAPVPYEKSIGKGFLTRLPSRRCIILLERVLADLDLIARKFCSPD